MSHTGSGLALPHSLCYKLTYGRPLRIEFENAFYHITSRGNAGNNIFLKKEDFKDFLEILQSVIDRYSWICHAYSLMNNHYHLLIETPKANLSLGMRQLNGVYTQSFNRRHKSYGHIFQGRFKAILIDKQSYLLELSRYIVLNPVRPQWHNKFHSLERRKFQSEIKPF
jgi:REP element-mobilizing transposase RayT